MSTSPARASTPGFAPASAAAGLSTLGGVLPQRPPAARMPLRQQESRVLQGNRASTQLSLFQRPNGR